LEQFLKEEWGGKKRKGAKMWVCRICSHENEEDAAICSECGSYQHEDLDAIADEMDESE